MHPLRFPILPVAAAVLAAALCAVAQPGYISPLTGSLSTHDPVMLKQDSTYYVFHTGNGVQIKTSRDRIAWAAGEPDRAYQTAPAWHSRFRNTTDSWAPAVSYWDGKYWLYYSISNFGARTSAIGLRTSPTLKQGDPNYAWADSGVAVCTYNNAATHPDCFHAPTTSVDGTDTTAFNAIDPDVIMDPGGTPWLSWGSFGSGIQIIRLNRQTGKPDSGVQPVTIAHRYWPAADAENGTGYRRSIEGPVITRHGAHYYLWYSHDRCCSAPRTYKVMVARSASVTGPYVDKAGNLAHPPYRANGATTGNWQDANGGTLVSKGDSINWAATGHSDIFMERDTVFLVNHGYTYPGNAQTRLMIRPLYWDAQAWPTLDSTRGVITPPATVSLRGETPSAARTRGPRFVRPTESFLVPWNGGVRDALGRSGREAGTP
jgi:arabinan endo-1,5-alpha-L-arabinosidase